MTLIAFATYGKKRAEFITDTSAYNAVADWTGRATKHLTLNHLDAAVLNIGPIDFGNLFRGLVSESSVNLRSFDDLADAAPALLLDIREYWRENSPSGNRTGAFYEPVITLIGWSDRAQEFVGYVLPGKRDFEPVLAEGLWSHPTPWSTRPSDLELDNLPDRPEAAMAREQWRDKAPRPVPARLDDWRSLAVDIRAERSHGWAGIPVGGDVLHTRLQRGSVVTRRIHSFDDTGEEFARMVEGTAHPVALARACYCGSGTPFGECHISDLLTQSCYCQSGAPFGQCCWQDRPAPSTNPTRISSHV